METRLIEDTLYLYKYSRIYMYICTRWLSAAYFGANESDDERSREFPWMEYVRFLGITGCTFNPLERVNFGAPRTEGKPFRYTTRRGKPFRIRYGIEGFVVEYRKWRYSKSIVSPYKGRVASRTTRIGRIVSPAYFLQFSFSAWKKKSVKVLTTMCTRVSWLLLYDCFH